MGPFLQEKIGDKKIILASASPRRHNLLRELGVEFEIRPANVDEQYPGYLKREEIPRFLAQLKASAFDENEMKPEELVITADTIVWMNNDILTKPQNREDALRIIRKLSGNMHDVYSGVCLKTKEKTHSFTACSEVFFRELHEQEIAYYVDTFQPYDKAGAYGIQEWIGYIGIEKITGSFFNVMGLPTQKLYEELLKF